MPTNVFESKGEVRSQESSCSTENCKIYTRLRVTWKVGNFTRSALKNTASSSKIDSCTFQMDIGRNKTKWCLRMYPNGNGGKKSCIGIQLVKKSEMTKNYEYSCRFSILNGDEEKTSKQFKSRASTNEAIDEGYGFMIFLSHGELLQWYDKFVDDSSTLTIRAEIELSKPKIEGELMESPEKTEMGAFGMFTQSKSRLSKYEEEPNVFRVRDVSLVSSMQ